MFAIVQLGGKQYKVREKEVLRIEKLDVPDGETTSVSEVLLTSDGKAANIGAPFLENAKVELKVLKTAKADKVYTFKMKAKKRYKKTKNHRQPYTEVEVVKITA